MYTIDENIDYQSFEKATNAVFPGTDPEKVLFFDIETTGLSPSRSGLYMIGCMFCEKNSAILRQFFADDHEDEKNALTAFGALLDQKSHIIHFNGSTFDIPYLKTKYEQHKLSKPFDNKKGIDLYRVLLPLKRILSLKSMKQKNLEELCGIYREDKYTGGELIGLYKEYQRKVLLNRSLKEDTDSAGISDMRRVLLLHNSDDMKGMLSVANLIGIVSFVSGEFDVVGSVTYDNKITAQITTARAIPQWALEKGSFLEAFTFEDSHRVKVDIPLIKGRMRLFMKDFRDHYYIPSQDMAVHVSVAGFMGSSDKKRATPATCYVPCEGTFAEIAEGDIPEGMPVIKRDYSERVAYIRKQDITNEVLKAAVMHVIQRYKENQCT